MPLATGPPTSLLGLHSQSQSKGGVRSSRHAGGSWQVLKLESERQDGVLGGTVADYGAAHKQAPHLLTETWIPHPIRA